MGLAQCFDSIAEESPPFNIACAPKICAQLQDVIDGHCRRNGYPRDQPYLVFGHRCHCCCNPFIGYGRDTAIALATGAFVKVQNIKPADTILTAGPELRWQPARVAAIGGTKTPGPRTD